MNPFRLVGAFIARKPFTWGFHVLTLALGVAVVVCVLLMQRALDERVSRDLAGVDLVVGAAGSPLQLILSSLFHIDAPTGNIPLEAAQRIERNAQVALAAPLSLGDTIKGVRIVGTDARLLQFYNAKFADGALWTAPMQVVLGAGAAKQLGKAIGATFAGTHGLSEGGETHDDHLYTVVGVLAPTGAAIDRLALTATESVWRVHDHPEAAPKDHDHDHDHAADAAAPQKPREITALLIRYRSAMGALMVPRMVKTIPGLQSGAPALEAARLNQLAGTGAGVLGAMGLGLLGLSALGLLVALSAAVQARRRDLVLLRTLGAKAPGLALITTLEALALGLLGGVLGLVLGRVGGFWAADAVARDNGLVLLAPPPGALEAACLAGAVGIAIVAAILPAIMAARTVPGAALQAG
jgi:putative ABC transport system permease protein